MKPGFPLVFRDHTTFPDHDACPGCGKPGVFEPNSFAFISGGASASPAQTEGSPPLRRHAFLSLVWHGAHDVGIGEDRGIYASVDIAEEVEGGSFELHFCSTRCMREFLNSCVDALEESIATERSAGALQ